jgi:hypothetical protein
MPERIARINHLTRCIGIPSHRSSMHACLELETKCGAAKTTHNSCIRPTTHSTSFVVVHCQDLLHSSIMIALLLRFKGASIGASLGREGKWS